MRVCITVALVLSVASAAVAEAESPFGVVCPWGGLKSAGIRWVRCGAGATALGNWPRTEPEQGKLDWTSSDEELRSSLGQNLVPLPIIGYTPEWASSEGKPSSPPRDVHSYAGFVRRFVERYKSEIRQIEIWNEPDIDFFSGTTSQYTELLKAGYTAARLGNPGCRVVFGGTAGVNLKFIEGVYDLGGGSFFDVMAVHPYQWGDRFEDEWVASQLKGLRVLMNSRGDSHKPIWLTELGWSTGDKKITEEVQARLLVQAMVTALSLRPIGVERAFWFSVKDWGGPGYGLLREDGSRKPAFKAYSVLTKALNEVDYLGRIDVGPEARCHVFRRQSGTTVAVVWSTGSDEAPVILDCKDGRVAGLTMLGENLSLAPVHGRLSLSARPEPVYLFDAGLKSIQPQDSMGYARAQGPSFDPAGVWVSAKAPEGTSRAYATAGAATELTFAVHNISDRTASGHIEFEAPGAERASRAEFRVEPGSSSEVNASVSLPHGAKEGVYLVNARVRCGQSRLPLSLPLRVAAGHTVEFLANSTVEHGYLFRNEHSGGAPSVRFSGTWVYRFDLSKAKSAKVRMNVGAHQAGEWRVLASRDDRTYETILSGASNRAWHECDLVRFVPGEVYLKFEGGDQQLEELVLTWQ